MRVSFDNRTHQEVAMRNQGGPLRARCRRAEFGRVARQLGGLLVSSLAWAGCACSPLSHLAPPSDAATSSDAATASDAATSSDTGPASDGGPRPDTGALDGGRGDATVRADATVREDAGSAGCRLVDTDFWPEGLGESGFHDGAFVVRDAIAYRLAESLEVIDLRDPDHPVLVAAVPRQAGYTRDIRVVDDVLWTSGGVLETFDLSRPFAPVSLGLIELDGEPHPMALDGSDLVVSTQRPDRTSSLVAIDASDPRAPVIGPSVELGRNEAYALALSGETAFALVRDFDAWETALLVVDLAGARVRERFALPEASEFSALVLGGDHLYIGVGGGARIFDVRDANVPVDLGRVHTELGWALSLTGDRLIVLGRAESDETACLYDVSSAPRLVPLGCDRFPSGDLSHGHLLPRHLVVSGGERLHVLPLDCGT